MTEERNYMHGAVPLIGEEEEGRKAEYGKGALSLPQKRLYPLEAPRFNVPLSDMLPETEGTIGFQSILSLPFDCSIPKHSLGFPRISDKFRTELQ